MEGIQILKTRRNEGKREKKNGGGGLKEREIEPTATDILVL